MPEGPSILLMKESLQKFTGEKVLATSGNAKVEKSVLIGKTLEEIRTFGKQTYLIFGEISVRVHLLMFGSYSVDEQIRPDKSLRLCLGFSSGEIYFYTCSIKLVDAEFLQAMPWEVDVLSDEWDPVSAATKLKHQGDEMVCDALLDQHIFSGVGNIIKNDVVFRIKVHPDTLLKDLSGDTLPELIAEA